MPLVEMGASFYERACHVAVSYKDYILIWGGCKKIEGDCLYYPAYELSCYHPLTKQWTQVRSELCSNEEPQQVASPTATIIGAYIYVFGGCIQTNNRSICHVNSFYRLSLIDFRWEKLNPAGPQPLAVDKLVSWSYNSKFYIFGGFGGPQTLEHMSFGFQFVHDDDLLKGWTNQFFEYDPQENKWAVPNYKGNLPRCRAAHAATIRGSKVFVFGGRHANYRMNDLHCLDMVTMEWTEITFPREFEQVQEPEGRSWNTLTAVSDSMLLICGGYSFRSKPLDDFWIFHLPTSKWEKLDITLEIPIFWHSACLTADNEVAVFGGCCNETFDNRVKGNMILITIFPKSLFKLCLERVEELNISSHWPCLPQTIREILVKRTYFQKSERPELNI